MPPTLTRREIAAGALSIVDGVGPDRVTARALGAALHVAPATLYTVVDSLSDVDAAARELLLDRLGDVLAAKGRDELVQSFLRWALEHRNAALFLTDPTSTHLDLAPRLFPDATDIEQIADLQAIVHAMIAIPDLDNDLAAATSALIDLYGRAQSSASAAGPSAPREQSALPELPARPTLLDLALQTIEGSEGDSRTKMIRSVGATLVDSEGLDGWAFRRVVEESGVPLTTLHRLGDRMAHLYRVKQDLSAGSWLRAGLVDADLSTRVSLATAEVAGSGLISLLQHLRRPASGTDWLGPIFVVEPTALALTSTSTRTAGDVIDLTDGSKLNRFDQLMRALGAIVVSRYGRSESAPERWAAAAGFAGAMTQGFIDQ